MPQTTITERAEWAGTALQEHADITASKGEPVADKARDLMVNLFHLLDKEGIDPKLINQQALAMHAQEKDEDPQ